MGIGDRMELKILISLPIVRRMRSFLHLLTKRDIRR